MAKRRSPNYPSIPLAEAIQKVARVYDAEHTHEATKEAVTEDLGYSSVSGRALAVIGALRAYGLLEGRGNLSVSHDATLILEFADEHENAARLDALARAAYAPSVFKELNERFGLQLPSNATLRHWLIEKGFLSKAADDVIRVHRENIEYLGDIGSFNPRHLSAESAEPAELPTPTEKTAETGDRLHFQDRVAVRMEGARPGVREDLFSLPEGSVRITWPDPITQESLEDIKAWLELVSRKLERSVRKQD